MAAIFSSSSCLRLSAVYRTLSSARGISDVCHVRGSRRIRGGFRVSASTLSQEGVGHSPLSVTLTEQGLAWTLSLSPRTASSLSSRVGNLAVRNMPALCIRHRQPVKCLSSAPSRSFSLSSTQLAKKRELVTIHFINRDGEKMTVKAWTGQNLLDIVVDNDLDIDGYGACEGTLSCSTCHLIFSEDLFKILPKPSDEELDMLDLAYGQTDMSRLGCQVILTKEMDGMTVIVPEGVADARDV